MNTSTKPAGVGRILHVHSKRSSTGGGWDGPRPGIVVNGPTGLKSDAEGNPVGEQRVNINVFQDGLNDESALAEVRKSSAGNTRGRVPVFDKLEDAADCNDPYVAVWPPRD